MSSGEHPAGAGFRADIEGLRAVAILLVVAAHADVPGLQGGFIGVDLFFVLSGYLISGLLVREIRATGQVSFRDFYARRIRRLLPALLTMLLVVTAAACVLLPPLEQLSQVRAMGWASLWASNMFFALQRLEYFGAEAAGNLFLHTWSLGVEEQFYLVWPALVMFLLGAFRWQAHGPDMRRLAIGMLVLMIACFLLSVFLGSTRPAWGFYLMPSRAWQFALGAMTCLLDLDHGPQARAIGRRLQAPLLRLGAAGAGLCLIVASALVLNEGTAPYAGLAALAPSLGAALVLFGCREDTGHLVTRLLSTPPMRSLGSVSYAWYLWHWPTLLLGYTLLDRTSPANRVALVALSLALAVASWSLVERPLRAQAAWLRRPLRSGAVALGVMVAGFALSTGWERLARSWAGSDGQIRYALVRSEILRPYTLGCDEWFYSARVVACGFGEASAPRTAVVMGDSVALQWFPVLEALYTRDGWKLFVLTKSGCPMVDLPFVYARIGRRYVECEAWRDEALAKAASLRPEVMIIGSGFGYPFDGPGWVEGSTKVLDRLAPASGRLFIIRATHALSFDGPACLSGRDWRAPLRSANHDCSTPVGDETGGQVFAWLQQAATSHPNVRVIDFNPLVCPDDLCMAERNGRIVYRDAIHLTPAFVTTLTERVKAALAQGEP